MRRYKEELDEIKQWVEENKQWREEQREAKGRRPERIQGRQPQELGTVCSAVEEDLPKEEVEDVKEWDLSNYLGNFAGRRRKSGPCIKHA